MRMRKLKHGDERRAACREYSIGTAAEIAEFFGEGSRRRVFLEIGAGKGDFAVGIAERHPDAAVLAVEKIADAAVHILEKAKERRLRNLRVLVADAKTLPELISRGSVDTLYLNFSDPWPKARHAERRLTHRAFLASYKTLLAPNGRLEFKTDNVGLFDFTLAELPEAGFEITYMTRDLHADKSQSEENVLTEYERNFSAKGEKINKVVGAVGSRPFRLSTPRQLII